ncbi:MAG: PRC-barrel domain-containing protein [Puia sp.]|nr:PRC-barrel domain-containing protein [Puia sp.]
MQRNINSLIGFRLDATDGEIGKVEEFYFDDDTWTIRYLILKTGNWLSGRKLLISPQSLISDPREKGMFSTTLTKEQVRNSPDIDTDKPVSRQQEIELHGYYPWQSYWGSGYYPGGIWGNVDFPPIVRKEATEEAGLVTRRRAGDDVHLRSTYRLTGYRMEGADGTIGHVRDFILDDQTWQILYLVVDTHQRYGGKKVLIEVGHVREVQWDHSTFVTDETIDSVNSSPSMEVWAFKHAGPSHALRDDHSIHLK